MFELMCCQTVLLNEIADKRMKRKDVAKTYALAMLSSDTPNWSVVNQAIIERWSRSGLEYIKKIAWSYMPERQTCRNCGGRVNTSTGYRICRNGCGGTP